jgi:DNA-binding SARP family transcriptional activator/pimeloyl-ACP methyl ester carboxylesterase
VALSVLGPLAVEGPSGPVPITGRKTREVLALLALAAPRPLTAAALADHLWDDPPPSAIKTVQAHVSRARTAVDAAHGEAGRIDGGQAGYRIIAGPAQLDVLAVEDLRRRARIATLAGHDHDAAGWLGEARRRWGGEPELPATIAGDAERARLAEEHLLLTEDQLAAEVSAGRPADVVGELQALTTRHPLRERLWELRMTALYRCGRQADAVAAYQTVRRHLRDEVGMEPGAALQALAHGVLRHTLPLTAPARPAAPADVPVEGPHYADCDGVHVAWGVYGTGPTDVLLLNPTFVPIDAYLEEPHLADGIAGLARERRVIVFDRRGLGLSDPVTPESPPTHGSWTQDAIAVLDAADAGRVHLLANADTGMIAMRLAATQPERIASVTAVNPYARVTVADDYPYGELPSVDIVLRGIRTPDVRPPVDVLTWIAPSVAVDPRFRAWWDAVGRRAASPRTAGLVHRAIMEGDVRDQLPLITAPVLLLSRLDCPSHDLGHARYLAAHLQRATLSEHPDPNGVWFLGDVAWTLDRFAAFVAAAGP